MSAKKTPKNLKYNRTFNPKETKEIRLYGLAKRDSFFIEGTSKKSILIRIMGGKGNDYIKDISSAQGSKKTIIYDYPEEKRGVTIEKGKETKTVYSEQIALNEYDRTKFKYNKYFPTPIILINADDGVGGGLLVNFKKYGFGHKTYKSKSQLLASATTNRSLHLLAQGERNIARTNWFYNGGIEYGNFFPFYNFYGFGNNTEEINDDLEDEEFYQIRHKGLITKTGITRKFLLKSFIQINTFLEILDQEKTDEGQVSILDNVEQFRAKNAAGAEIKFTLDFRDSPSFTTRGIKLDLSQTSYVTDSGPFGRTAVELSYYGTARIGLPVTLGIKLGTERLYGTAIPYYHLANAGQTQHLRGFRANRFAGKGVNYINTDLRIHLGKSQQDFLPFYYGLGTFLDVAQVINNDNIFEEIWHTGYGLGVYLTPINKDFLSLNINVSQSTEEKLLFNLGLGVIIK